jgi:hypothetical protein
MDHRCPVCGKDLSARRLTQPVIARMEIDCPFCKSRIGVNVHPAESALMVASFAGFVLFAALYYFLKREGFLVAALAALSGAALLPFLERTWLKAWPRYKAKPGTES